MMNDGMHIGVEEAVARVARGEILIVTDDEDRENEGDFIQAAEHATPESINFMATFGRGLICQGITADRARELGLPPMVAANTSAHETAFTLSVDGKDCTSTGISAFDRAATVALLCAEDTRPGDLARPGHVFPLVAHPGGVRARAGHTEASVELAALAGCRPSGLLCEILSPDGSMARMGGLEEVAGRHGLGILTIRALREWLDARDGGRETAAAPGAPQEGPSRPAARIPTEFGEFTMVLHPSDRDGREDFLLVRGEPGLSQAPLVRIHSECLTGEVLGSLRCDCAFQLRESMRMIADEDCGVVVYLRQEGRGIGLADKLRAYALQEQGQDTVEANRSLGLPDDAREYSAAARMLSELGVRHLRLLTNNPGKIEALEREGIRVVSRVGIEAPRDVHNGAYLRTKKERCGHLLRL